MPGKFFLIILFFLSSFTIHAQKSDFKTGWTNGFEFYDSEWFNDSLVFFSGGNLHEGGYMFTVIYLNNIAFIYGGNPENNENSPALGEINDEVELKKVNGIKVLLIKHVQGRIKALLREMRPNESLQNLVEKNKINFELAGTYRDSKTNKEVIFYPNEKRIKGLASSEKYVFEVEYDSPADVLTFSGKQSFSYVLTETGMDIYKAEQDKYDEWVEREKVFSLQKTGWFNISGNASLEGNYSFASTTVLIDGILSCYSKTQLKIMRNEIFARHGYIFKSEEMKSYFEKRSWYRPEKEDVTNDLTELEKLNIQLIQQYEIK